MNDTEKNNNQRKETDNNYYPNEKSHWEKYQLYYLVFGSFFVTAVIILISNHSTNKQIRKINERLNGQIYSSFNFGSSSEMSDYLSRLKKEPFPDYVKKRVEEEIRKIQGSFFGDKEKESREE
jgi:hypothetical protein